MPRRPLLPLAAVLALSLSACARPSDVAVQFHQALAKGDEAKAFSLLSTPTQARLTAIAREAHAKSSGLVSDDPRVMIGSGDLSLYPPPTPARPKKGARASPLSENGPRAKVSVHLGEASHEMDLVREGGAWRIDLPIGSP